MKTGIANKATLISIVPFKTDTLREWFIATMEFPNGKCISVPFPAETIVTDENGMEEVIPPPYIRHLETGNFKAALKSIALQHALTLSKTKILDVGQVYMGHVAVDAGVPYGHVLIKHERIILNESHATEFNTDADGDMASVCFLGDGYVAVFKNPHTTPMQAFKLLDCDYPLCDDFEDLVIGEEVSKKHSIEEFFKKNHTDPLVGIMTNKWMTWFLYQGIGKSFAEKCHLFASDPGYNTDIEESGLQASRNGEMTTTTKFTEKKFFKTLTSLLTLGTIKANSISKADPEDLRNLMKVDYDEDWNQFRKLECSESDFEIKERKKFFKRLPRYLDGSLISRLFEFGLLNCTTFSNRITLETVIIRLEDPRTGKPIGLYETKRDTTDGFAFALPPIYGMAFQRQENGAIDFDKPKVKKLMHPLEHMENWFTENFESAIVDSYGQLHGFWPATLGDLCDEKWMTKAGMIMDKIKEYMNEFSDSIKFYDDKLLPHTESIIRNTIGVDYVYWNSKGREIVLSSAMEKWNFLSDFYQITGLKTKIAFQGSKSDNNRYRKYMRAKDSKQVYYASDSSHLARPSKQRSQMLNATKEVEMSVCIISGRTNQQVYITPSGIEKQLITNAYLDQVRTTEPDENDEKYWHKTVISTGLHGTKRTIWLGDPKSAQRAGKLICPNGMKFMTIPVDENWNVTGTQPVDLIVNISEIKAKSCTGAWLKNAIDGEVTINGKTYKCKFATIKLYRTGATGENMIAGIRNKTLKGMDIFMFFSLLFKFKKNHKLELEVKWDLSHRTGCDALRELYDDVVATVNYQE